MLERTYCIECDKLMNERVIPDTRAHAVVDGQSAFSAHHELNTICHTKDGDVLVRESCCDACYNKEDLNESWHDCDNDSYQADHGWSW